MAKTGFLLLIFCAGSLFAQPIQVEKRQQLTNLHQGEFYFPQFSTNGQKIFFTAANYRGLYALDLADNKIRQLNDLPGAGYHPVFSQDGNRVYFTANQYIGGHRHSALIEQKIDSGDQRIIEHYRRQELQVKSTSAHAITYQKNQSIQLFDTLGDKIKSTVMMAQMPLLNKEKTKLILYFQGKRNVFEPLGPGHYIWASFSPDKQQILFTRSGDGTYISDLDGNILYELGIARAPKWSPDGKHITYMVDEDDGYRITRSEIFVAAVDGSQRSRLSDRGLIDLYPSWSPDGSKIVFHSGRGEIVLFHLSGQGGD